MITLASVAKYAPAPAIGLLAGSDLSALPDPLVMGAVVVGLIAGAGHRAAGMVHAHRTWADVRSDLLVSFMAGLANAILAIFVVDRLEGGPLAGLVCGMVAATFGTELVTAFARQWRTRMLGSADKEGDKE